MAQIHEAICAAMGRTGAIGKDKKNQQQGFKYRGVDDVMNALQPVFAEFMIFCTPRVIEIKREERQTKNGGAMTYTVVTVEYTFYAADGSSVSCVVCGEGMDSADKSTSKAMSIAFKYACFQLLCIPTEETAPDPDREYHEKLPHETEPPVTCTKCGKAIAPVKGKDGTVKAPKDVAEQLGGLCPDCWRAAKSEAAQAAVEAARETAQA
ncbi:MAG: ERF family protein [Clostridia bacterium]|nr:ERF family protein [Clostridia bacterium]